MEKLENELSNQDEELDIWELNIFKLYINIQSINNENERNIRKKRNN